MSNERFRLGELFCGPGGIACGAMKAKSDDGRFSIVHAWANDYDPDTCQTYIKNICPDEPDTVYCGDVRDLDIGKLGEVGVKDRIKSVLNYKKPAFWVVLVAVILSFVLAICFVSNPVNDKVNSILNEDGYEVFSAKEQNISIFFGSRNLTDKMFEKDGVYKVRSRDIINDCVIFRFKEVHSHDDMFTLTFDVTYEDVPDDGTIYVVSANQFEGGLELGEEIKVSDPFGGEVGDGGPYSSYCHSKVPDMNFVLMFQKLGLKTDVIIKSLSISMR